MQTVTFRSPESAWPELRSALRSRGLTLADVARATGRPYITLSKCWNGYQRPTEDLVQALAALLSLNPDRLRPRSAKG